MVAEQVGGNGKIPAVFEPTALDDGLDVRCEKKGSHS